MNHGAALMLKALCLAGVEQAAFARCPLLVERQVGPHQLCSEQKSGLLLLHVMIPFVMSSQYVMLLYLVFALTN